ncbi:MAG: DUF305 domain-containing protein [Actinomycetota bacterium]|nr:DUF305 domain-containing protein [Actinomycetota bacterium]
MQKKYVNLLLPALILVAILALVVSCANSGGGEEQGSSGSEDGMQGMAHGSETTDGASEMLMENGEYSDERFIDAMVPHHQGAIEMAQVALENAEHTEILVLAEDVVSAQEAEIGQLKAIKQEQFGTSEVSMDMSAEEMEGMGMTMDPQELATQEPFDKAFIDNMIPHHESAIEMAQVALEESENPEIREIAGAIVNAQEREIEQMRSWRDEWYPEG